VDLQIIRTRHPPEAYLGQVTELLRHSGPPVTTPEDLRRRLQLMPESDRFLLAMDAEALIGYAHLRVVHDLLEEETVELVSIVVATRPR